eukprot:275863-Hanusia_phi.AAC.1
MESMKEIYDVLVMSPAPVVGLPCASYLNSAADAKTTHDADVSKQFDIMDQQAQAVFSAESVTFVITDL